MARIAFNQQLKILDNNLITLKKFDSRNTQALIY